MKIKVGQVTEAERNEIQQLFERKNGLNELVKIISPVDDALYERVVRDMGATATKFQQWWDKKSTAYKWKQDDNGNWEIDFQTCEIFLNIKD